MSRRLGPDETRLWQAVTAALEPDPVVRRSGGRPGRPGGRGVKPDEERLWHAVTATFYPTPIRHPGSPGPAPKTVSAAATPPAPELHPAPKARPYRPPEPIEPGRSRRISREPRPEARLDLHGLDQDRAKAALTRFILSAHEEGCRSCLVITGKGVRGDGVLRHRTPEWLAEPALRHAVAGISPAHRRHGGEGALYVALKRKSR